MTRTVYFNGMSSRLLIPLFFFKKKLLITSDVYKIESIPNFNGYSVVNHTEFKNIIFYIHSSYMKYIYEKWKNLNV